MKSFGIALEQPRLILKVRPKVCPRDLNPGRDWSRIVTLENRGDQAPLGATWNVAVASVGKYRNFGRAPATVNIVKYQSFASRLPWPAHGKYWMSQIPLAVFFWSFGRNWQDYLWIV